MASKISLVENFLELKEKRMIFIGGLPRSGTSSCESFFHAHDGCFVFDEYHPFKSKEYLDHLSRHRDYGIQQLEIWADSSGRDWRGFDSKDYLKAGLSIILFTLNEHTKRNKFFGKDLRKVRVLANKLPHLEDSYLEIRDELSNYGVETHFIYCVRDPVFSLTSNWQMPWVTTDDPAIFAKSYLGDLKNSLQAMESIPSSERSIWFTPQRHEDSKILGLGIDDKIKSWIGSLNSEPIYSDEWPKERRRLRLLPDDIICEFAASDAVRRFRQKFQFQNHSEGPLDL